MRNKHAQVTLFIILGISLVVAILLLYFLKFSPSILKNPISNPEAYIQKCVQDSIRESEEIILESNGYPSKDFKNYIFYNQEKVPYLCTSSEFYTGCMPQEPAFLSYIENLMSNKVNVDAENCLILLKKDFESKGYKYTETKTLFNLSIKKGYVQVKISKDIFASKEDSSFKISSFEIQQNSGLYDLIRLVQTIVNYESTTCDFNYMNWMKYQNEIIINRFRASDQTKIYSLEDRESKKEIKFAVKDCVLPAGI